LTVTRSWLPLANFSQNVRLPGSRRPKKPLIAVIQVFDWNYQPELLDNRPNREGSCDALAAESGRDARRRECRTPSSQRVVATPSPQTISATPRRQNPQPPTNGAPFVPRDAGVARTFSDGVAATRSDLFDEIRCNDYCALAEGANGCLLRLDDGKWRIKEHSRDLGKRCARWWARSISGCRSSRPGIRGPEVYVTARMGVGLE